MATKWMAKVGLVPQGQYVYLHACEEANDVNYPLQINAILLLYWHYFLPREFQFSVESPTAMVSSNTRVVSS